MSFHRTPFTVGPHPSQLKMAWELDKMKGLNLEELWLEGNPLCSIFSDHSVYIKYIMPADTSSPHGHHCLLVA